MTQTPLGHKLRVLRAERELTLREAASHTGVAKETISDIERGIRHPHDVTVAKLARAYGVPVEELLEEPALPLDKASREGGQPSEDIEGTTYSFQEYLAEHIEAPEVLLEGLHNSDIPASRSEAAIVSQYIRLRGRKPGEHSSEAGLSQIDYMTEYADEVIDRERIALLVAYVLERDGFAKDDTALSLVLRDEIAKLDKNAES
jgi:transcriptional regulator with XRE-family HTH domain